MNSVPENRVGVASGINNAVSRTAGLLAIAVFGIVMLQSFDRRLDRALVRNRADMLPAREALSSQRDKLAGAELPEELNPDSAGDGHAARSRKLSSAVFAVVMGLGAILAIGSAVSAAVLIRAESRKA